MFPLTSKMNDKFPLTQDINSGVSGIRRVRMFDVKGTEVDYEVLIYIGQDEKYIR